MGYAARDTYRRLLVAVGRRLVRAVASVRACVEQGGGSKTLQPRASRTVLREHTRDVSK
jgi:hypothetical protein